MRKKPRKKSFAKDKSAHGRLAQALSISLYPTHYQLLKQRELHLGVPRSILLQLLLELDARNDLLGREILARLSHNDPGPTTPTE